MFLTLQFSWLEKESKDQFKSHPAPPPPSTPPHNLAIKIFSFFQPPTIPTHPSLPRLSLVFNIFSNHPAIPHPQPPCYSTPPSIRDLCL